jgi:hypothetical protein
MNPNGRLAAVSLCLVAAAIPAWWLALYASEAFRGLFVRPEGWSRLQPFLYADLALAAVTGMAGVNGFRASLSGLLAGLVIGGWGYATLWTVGTAASGSLSTLGAGLMMAALVLVSVAARALVSTGRARDR